MIDYVTKTVILNEGEVEAKRAEIRDYFHKTYEADNQVYTSIIEKETYYLRADPLRHPLIFYYGHTAAFFVNKLILAKIINKRVNPEFESMFAVGVDEMSWDDLNDKHYDWPKVEDVKAYRVQVRDLVDGLIMNMELSLPINWESPFWLIMMGIEHQRIHIETSSVLIRQLPITSLQSMDILAICNIDSPIAENDLLPVKGKNVILGKPLNHGLFGWDLEYGSHEFAVQDFEAGKYLVSNQEFLAFVEADGYHNQSWWTKEGWDWRMFAKADHPKFWVKQASKWLLRLVTQEIELPWSWPAEVNYLEAKAFCNWKAEKTGLPVRLPTEAEWYLLYDENIMKDQPYWETAPGNINLEHFSSPCPVDMFKQGDFYDLMGNVWQWTETPVNGFAGYKVHPSYDDFSAPTFDGRHNMIKGGSWISTGNEATRDARFAFRRHFFQHAGFRYVAASQPLEEFVGYYEDDKDVIPLCETDYGDVADNFSQRVLDICRPLIGKSERALNIGCSVGRASFEMAKDFEKVIGLDFTARLINVAEKMKNQGKIKYQLTTEGELVAFKEVSLKELGLDGTAEKVEFWQADASNLSVKFKDYDFIFAQNILEKLYNPENFLNVIIERINSGGILVISSTYDWDEKYTARENWLGGFRKDGEPFYSQEALSEIFAGKLKEIKPSQDLSFTIRQNDRIQYLKTAQIIFWQKI